ncbi:MAG: glycosyltransferase [Chloroflexota bacterium]
MIARMPLSSAEPTLSVVIPAHDEAENLAILLPALRRDLERLGVASEIVVVCREPDGRTWSVVEDNAARLVKQERPGYGGALVAGFAEARGEWILTMDADLSHRPNFIADLWNQRDRADFVIASRYVPGGSAEMPRDRYLMSRLLNETFRTGLALPLRDLSSGYRLFRRRIIEGMPITSSNFAAVQEIVVRAAAAGWTVTEVPFAYAPREHGDSKARALKFGPEYLRTLGSLWKLRNSVASADYDYRAHDSRIPLQRYWQRTRYRHVTDLIAGEGPVLDVGCGSSRIVGALPPGSVALDVLPGKLRVARRMGAPVVTGTIAALPFRAGAFPCVLCSEVVEHVPVEWPSLDELERVLAPGGRLVLGTPDYARWEWNALEWAYGKVAPNAYADEHITHYSHASLVGQMESRGLRHEETRYVGRGEMIIAFRKGR